MFFFIEIFPYTHAVIACIFGFLSYHRGRWNRVNKPKQRNIFTEFLRWGDADKILNSAQAAQKVQPYSFNGKAVMIFVDPLNWNHVRG